MLVSANPNSIQHPIETAQTQGFGAKRGVAVSVEKGLFPPDPYETVGNAYTETDAVGLEAFPFAVRVNVYSNGEPVEVLVGIGTVKVLALHGTDCCNSVIWGDTLKLQVSAELVVQIKFT